MLQDTHAVPVFTSTDAHSTLARAFSGEEPPPLLTPQRNPQFLNKPREHLFMTVYLHGDAQDMCGFDIPVLIDGVWDMHLMTGEGQSGEILCRVENAREVKEAILVWWQPANTSEGWPRLSGLICLTTDYDALRYARSRQENFDRFL